MTPPHENLLEQLFFDHAVHDNLTSVTEKQRLRGAMTVKLLILASCVESSEEGLSDSAPDLDHF